MSSHWHGLMVELCDLNGLSCLSDSVVLVTPPNLG